MISNIIMINTDFPLPAIIESDTLSPPTYVEASRDDFETEQQNIDNIIELLINTFNLIGIDNADEIIQNIKENPENFINDDKPIIKRLSMAIIDYKKKIYDFENREITSSNPLLKKYIDLEIKKVYEHIEDKYRVKLNETQKELGDLRKEFNNLKYIYDSNTLQVESTRGSLLRNAIINDNLIVFNYLITAFTFEEEQLEVNGRMQGIFIYYPGYNAQDNYDYTLKMIKWTFVGGNLDILKYLVNMGFEIDYDDSSYLEIAIRWGRYDMVEYLLENDAIVNEEYHAPDSSEGNRIKKLLLKHRGNVKINLGFNGIDIEQLKTSDKS